MKNYIQKNLFIITAVFFPLKTLASDTNHDFLDEISKIDLSESSSVVPFFENNIKMAKPDLSLENKSNDGIKLNKVKSNSTINNNLSRELDRYKKIVSDLEKKNQMTLTQKNSELKAKTQRISREYDEKIQALTARLAAQQQKDRQAPDMEASLKASVTALTQKNS
ncbi:TPA: hypothetical protein ACXRUV_005112, partial [Klebsiella quasipneumoniae subsp. similipneumoniae]